MRVANTVQPASFPKSLGLTMSSSVKPALPALGVTHLVWRMPVVALRARVESGALRWVPSKRQCAGNVSQAIGATSQNLLRAMLARAVVKESTALQKERQF